MYEKVKLLIEAEFNQNCGDHAEGIDAKQIYCFGMRDAAVGTGMISTEESERLRKIINALAQNQRMREGRYGRESKKIEEST